MERRQSSHIWFLRFGLAFSIRGYNGGEPYTQEPGNMSNIGNRDVENGDKNDIESLNSQSFKREASISGSTKGAEEGLDAGQPPQENDGKSMLQESEEADQGPVIVQATWRELIRYWFILGWTAFGTQ